jgi:hypothetical protein
MEGGSITLHYQQLPVSNNARAIPLVIMAHSYPKALGWVMANVGLLQAPTQGVSLSVL